MSSNTLQNNNLITPLALQITVDGIVQAVGFRPFVYNLAQQYKLCGSVQNQGGIVKIIVQGEKKNLELFQIDLISRAPPLAKPYITTVINIRPTDRRNFKIEQSSNSDISSVHLPVDYYICNDCLNEMLDPGNRRYRYPLISCTQCGPRYTVIKSLPYDRCNTTLAEYDLCAECQQEYEDPGNRRYHAETISCHHCGPQLSYVDKERHIVESNNAVITYAVNQLRAGKILAVKGIGGYHLLCDAGNHAAVDNLRQRKKRPDKPFAVMLPLSGDKTFLNRLCKINTIQMTLLESPQRPIVLLEKNENYDFPSNISPGLTRLGVMLPYSPLHTLLLNEFDKAVIATSGNMSGEPVIIGNGEAEKKLDKIADGFVHHDRQILIPIDDSVYQVNSNRPQPLRLARGIAPLEFELPFTIDTPTLALGAMFKNTVALAWDNRLLLSPHIGDMNSPKSIRTLEKVSEQLQKVYKVKAERLVYDAHPQYSQKHWAEKQKIPLKTVYHHYAHASALAFEQPLVKQWLTFTWDGTGFGDDNTIWGGETLLGAPGQWQRVASLKPFYLPGGDNVNNKPLLSALSLCWEAGLDPGFGNVNNLIKEQWLKRINCPQSTAIGRIFDAAAALLDLIQETSFQGQAPMLVEAISDHLCNVSVDLPITYCQQRQLWEVEWTSLLPMLMKDNHEIEHRAACLHVSLANMIINQIKLLKNYFSFDAVGFSGGVFQNQLLCTHISRMLKENNIEFYFHERLPSNDAAICVGQIMEQKNRQY